MPEKSESVLAIEAAAKLANDAICKAGDMAVTAISEAVKASHEGTNSSIEVIKNNIEHIQTDVKDIKAKLETQYITKDEFDPVKRVVYGLVALILVAVVGALLALVLKK